jgi:hypothetical protein
LSGLREIIVVEGEEEGTNRRDASWSLELIVGETVER